MGNPLEIITKPKYQRVSPVYNSYFLDGETAMFLLSCLYQSYKTRAGYAYDIKIPANWECLSCNEDFILLRRVYSTELVIAFTGRSDLASIQAKPTTTALSNWPLNKDQRKSVRVHKDLFDNYLTIVSKYRSIFNMIEEEGLKRSYQRIYIAGHGTGSASANFLAFDLAPKLGNQISVYTFGSPRVGNSAFAEAYNSLLGRSTFNIMNSADLVPTIPWVHLDTHVLHKAIKAAGLAITISSAATALLIPLAPLTVLFQLAALLGPSIYYLVKVIRNPAFKHVGLKFYLTDELEQRVQSKLAWKSPKDVARHHDLIESYIYPMYMSILNNNGDHLAYKMYTQGFDLGPIITSKDDYTQLKSDDSHNSKLL